MTRWVDAMAETLRVLALTLVVVILLMPVLLALVLSFDARTYIGPLPPPELSLRWYRSFFGSGLYLQSLGWSLAVTSTAVLISTVAGVLAALYLNGRGFRGRELLLSIFLSPLIIPHVVIGFGLLMATARYGIDSPLLRLMAGHLLLAMPFTIRLTLVGLQGLSKSLREAAMTLGARPVAVFWRITFPLIRPGIVASGIFAAATSMGESAASVFLAGNGVRTLPVALLSEMRNNLDLTIAAASGVLAASTLFLVIILDWTVGLSRVTGRGTFSRLV